MKRLWTLLFPLAAVAALNSMAMPTAARATASESRMHGQLVDVRVLVDGRTASLFAKPFTWGSQKRYFEAFQDGRYAVELRNLTNRRIGVLMSVDGLNVVTGERSDLLPTESMYVLDPFESATIRGWRTSLDDVRQFVFVDEQRSYAERTGQANGDMGWIRVVTFEEQRPLAWGRNFTGYRDGASAAPPPSTAPEAGREARKDMAAPHAEGQAGDEMTRNPSNQSFPGTGWGEQREDHVNRVDFRAASAPTDQLVLRYEYADGLRALGIDTRRSRLWDRDHGQLGFAKPPRW
jgi:hypothetical protein